MRTESRGAARRPSGYVPPTPAELLENWSRYQRAQGIAENTLAKRVAEVSHAIKAIGDPTQWTGQGVLDYLGASAEAQKPSYWNNRRSYLRIFCAWLATFGHRADNPLDAVPVRKQPTQDTGSRAMTLDEIRKQPTQDTGSRAMTLDEIRKLVQSVRKHAGEANSGCRERWLWYLTVALTGLRNGELARMGWEHFDLVKGTLWVPADVDKMRIERTLPLAPEVRQHLADHWERQGRPESGPLLWVRYRGRDVPFALVDKQFNRDVDRAGIVRSGRRPLTRHGLRKTHTMLLETIDCPPDKRKALSRHAGKDVADAVYVDRSIMDLRSWVDRLPRLLDVGDAVGKTTQSEASPVQSPNTVAAHARTRTLETVAERTGRPHPESSTPASPGVSPHESAPPPGEFRGAAPTGASHISIAQISRGSEPSGVGDRAELIRLLRWYADDNARLRQQIADMTERLLGPPGGAHGAHPWHPMDG